MPTYRDTVATRSVACDERSGAEHTSGSGLVALAGGCPRGERNTRRVMTITLKQHTHNEVKEKHLLLTLNDSNVLDSGHILPPVQDLAILSQRTRSCSTDNLHEDVVSRDKETMSRTISQVMDDRSFIRNNPRCSNRDFDLREPIKHSRVPSSLSGGPAAARR